MKKLLLSSIISTILLAGCGPNSSSSTEENTANESSSNASPKVAKSLSNSSTKTDAEKYIKSVKPILKDATELGNRWDELRKASANGEISDAEFGSAIAEEILPRNLEISEASEALSLKIDDKFVDTHELLIEMLNKQHLAFTEVISAVDTGDASKLTTANEYLNDVRTIERKYARELEKLKGE